MRPQLTRRVAVETPLLSCICDLIDVDGTEMIDAVYNLEMPAMGAGWNFELFVETLKRASSARMPFRGGIAVVRNLE